MKNVLFLFVSTLLLFTLSCTEKTDDDTASDDLTKVNTTPVKAEQERADYAIVIHGGAGTIKKENMTEEKEQGIRAAMNNALDTGEKVLKAGGTAMDAVTQTIMVLENSPYFNAGKGAVFTNEGKNEMDASFMDGKTQNAGAIGGVTNIKNPILAARAVMENSVHVMLSGKGAEEFAQQQGIEQIDPKYFYTDFRWEALQRAKAKEKQSGYLSGNPDYKYGTVGCAALDKEGNLAAGTSTGGMTNKRWNRIGDAPIIGAGTYANNNTCATSSTGHGEFYIRYVVAHDISAMVEYKGTPFQEAAKYVIEEKLKQNGGSGGLIGVDKYGNVAMPFNTAGMYRGYAKPDERVVKIYK